MPTRTRFITALLLFALLGCQHGAPKAPVVRNHRSQANEAMIRVLNDQAARNAILSERTVYPHHFAKYSDQLNSLGQRQLAILAEGLRAGLDTLHMPRGQADDTLYQQRQQTIRAALRDCGIEIDNLTLRNAMPAGDGAWSQDVRRALQQQRKAGDTSDPASTTMNSGTTTEGVIK